MQAILYTSRNLLGPGKEDQLLDIRTKSLARNGRWELSGMLVATPFHFAQVIEGPVLRVKDLMAIVTNDPRHSDLVVLADRSIARRSFRKWTMLSFASGHFLERYLEPAIRLQRFSPTGAEEGQPLWGILKGLQPSERPRG